MKKKSEQLFYKIIGYSFYLFVFLLPWQIKYILRPAVDNFNEISLYLCHLPLFVLVMSFLFYKIRKNEGNDRVPFLWLLISGVGLFSFLSFFFALDKSLSFYRFIIFLFGVALLYFLKESFKPQPYKESIISKSKTVIIFLSSIFLHVCLGLYQFLTQKTFAFKYLGLAEHNAEVLGSSVVETFSGRWLRAYGGFDHPNIFGGILAIALILSLYFLIRKKIINTRFEIFESIFLFIFYFSGLLALIFTFSRSAWLAFGVSLVALFFTIIFKKNKSALSRLLILSIFSLILSSVIFFSFQDIFSGRLTAKGRLEEKSLIERQTQIDEARVVLKDNWLFGAGLGNYISYFKNEERNNGIKKADWEYQPVHNSFLLIWAEGGIFVLVFSVMILIPLARSSERSEFFWPLILALFFIMFFDHWIISLPFGFIFLFFVLGLI